MSDLKKFIKLQKKEQQLNDKRKNLMAKSIKIRREHYNVTVKLNVVRNEIRKICGKDNVNYVEYDYRQIHNTKGRL